MESIPLLKIIDGLSVEGCYYDYEITSKHPETEET